MASSSNWTAEQCEKWEKGGRALGRNKYVVYRGVIGWGWTCGITIVAINLLILNYSYTLTSLFANLSLWMFAGFLWGICRWKTSEDNYLKAKQAEADSADA